MVCLTLACCWRLLPPQVRGSWCPPWVFPPGSGGFGGLCGVLGGAGLGWQPGQVSLSTAAGAGTSPRVVPGCEHYLWESCESRAMPWCPWIMSGCSVTTEPVQEPPPIKCWVVEKGHPAFYQARVSLLQRSKTSMSFWMSSLPPPQAYFLLAD